MKKFGSNVLYPDVKLQSVFFTSWSHFLCFLEPDVNYPANVGLPNCFFFNLPACLLPIWLSTFKRWLNLYLTENYPSVTHHKLHASHLLESRENTKTVVAAEPTPARFGLATLASPDALAPVL